MNGTGYIVMPLIIVFYPKSSDIIYMKIYGEI